MDNVLEIGFRFLPPDEEIISFFLKKKMMGDHKTTRYIREVDLLKHEPWQLPGNLLILSPISLIICFYLEIWVGDFLFPLERTAMSVVQSTYPEWLFFYKLNKISQRKNDRSTNDGYWKSTGADRPITCGDSLIGTKKTLVFYKGRTPNGLRTDWVMHEFRATADSLPPNAVIFVHTWHDPSSNPPSNFFFSFCSVYMCMVSDTYDCKLPDFMAQITLNSLWS